MKLNTFIFFFSFLLFASAIYGQARIANPKPAKVVRNTLELPKLAQQRFMVADTLAPLIFEDTCSLGAFSYLNSGGDGSWGFVGGMNDFIDLEKAQRFYYDKANFEVLNAIIFFASAAVVGDGVLTAKIYEIDPNTNGPGFLAGTSDALKVSDLAVDEQFIVPTIFNFSTPAVVSGTEFFVSIDFSQLYESQDTVGILMTDINCGDGADSWELFGDGETWVPINDENNSWGLDASFFMLAIVQSDGTSASKELLVGDSRIRLHEAFPNPAKDEMIISYELETSAMVRIEIYSADGKLVKKMDQSRQLPGQYQKRITTQNMPSGIYLYGIVTDKGKLMNKLTIVK